MLHEIGNWLGDWWWSAALVVCGLLAGLLIHWIVFVALRRISARTSNTIDDLIVRHCRRPTQVILPLLVLVAILPASSISPDIEAVVLRIAVLGFIAGVAWLTIATLNVVAGAIEQRFDVTQTDNLEARRVLTQVQVIRRVCVVVVIFLAAAGMLMTFPSLRHIGVSLFASAGVAGLVVGLAARPTLSNLIAGLQIALTDPFRLEDVVIVENEWGWIEDIRTTYVVVRIWDLRRLVVPLTYFIEKPFENWTRETADLLGTVYLYVDYTVPVEEVRQELHRVLQSSDLWDGKVWGLQVTNATGQTLELRALMSAPSSPAAWNLRCMVREKLVHYLQERFPASLPKMRAELTRTMEDGGLSETASAA